MFGQELGFPVDFLLGRVQEPVGGAVHDWFQEHQDHLQIAFEGARDQLRTAVECKKKVYDQHVRGLALKEDQLMLL